MAIKTAGSTKKAAEKKPTAETKAGPRIIGNSETPTEEPKEPTLKRPRGKVSKVESNRPWWEKVSRRVKRTF